MVDTATLAALALLALGVVGTVVPGLPGGLSSLVGLWVPVVFGDGGPLSFGWLLGFSLVALAVVAVEYLGGAVAAGASGVSTRTTVSAGVVGFLGLFVVGPVGVLLGVVGTVFLLEMAGGDETDEALRSAAWTAMGMLAATAVQVALTLSVFVGYVVFAFLL